MALTQLEFLIGLFSLIVSLISIYVGLHIALTYRKHKNTSLLFVGISWTGLANGWWPTAISFMMEVTMGTSLEPAQFFIIGNVLIPWWLFLWMIAMIDFLRIKRKKLVLLVFLAFAVIYNFVLFYYIATDISKIGTLDGPVNAEYEGLISLFLLILLVSVLITGLLFAREALKTNTPETRLKGKLIATAFISYTIAAIADASISLDIFSLIVIRLVLISSSVEFYIAMLMPEWIKKRLLKEQE